MSSQELTPDELAEAARVKSFRAKYPTNDPYFFEVLKLIEDAPTKLADKIALGTINPNELFMKFNQLVDDSWELAADPAVVAVYWDNYIARITAGNSDHRECEILPTPDFSHGNQHKS